MRSLALLAGLLALPAAQAIEFKPKLELEGRWFYEAPDEPSPSGSVAGTLEGFTQWGDHRIVGELFGRYDDQDDQRTHWDVRELYYQQSGDSLEFRAGARRVFWGVTESRHLVDIINQSDFVENISNEQKLGQPMASLTTISDYGNVEFFLMPFERERTFPGDDGYPRLPFPVAEYETTYQSKDEDRHLDYAVRYTGSFGPLDVGFAWFDGTSRDPRLDPCVKRGASGQYWSGSPDGPTCPPTAVTVTPPPPVPPPPPDWQQQVAAEVQASIVLVPRYDLLRQASLDAQWVVGNMAWKVEALRRETLREATWATVSGFEYTFGDIAGSGVDIGVLGEYLRDGKHEALYALVDDEIFGGTRVALNDVAGTQVLAGVIWDRDTGKSLRYGVEASGRLNDDWKLSAEARIFSKWPREDQTIGFLADQSFVTLTLERFF